MDMTIQGTLMKFKGDQMNNMVIGDLVRSKTSLVCR